MTESLDQEESTYLIREIRIIPNGLKIQIKKEKNKTYVTRVYNIDMTHTKHFTMNQLVIYYNRILDRVLEYKVCLTDDDENEIILCKDNSEFITTFFENLILLEMSNWRRVDSNKKPIRTIDDYNNYKFEINLEDKKALRFLQNCISKCNIPYFKGMNNYSNTNKIVPYQVWKTIQEETYS